MVPPGSCRSSEQRTDEEGPAPDAGVVTIDQDLNDGVNNRGLMQRMLSHARRVVCSGVASDRRCVCLPSFLEARIPFTIRRGGLPATSTFHILAKVSELSSSPPHSTCQRP